MCLTGAVHLTWRIQMLRKISFAAATAVAFSAAAMSPASAGGGHGGHGGHGMHGGHHHGHGGHWGGGFGRFYGSSAFYIGGDCYKYVETRRGLRLVNVCAF